MKIADIFFPWFLIADQRNKIAGLECSLERHERALRDKTDQATFYVRSLAEQKDALDRRDALIADLQAQIAKFDGDGDGRIGGSAGRRVG